VNVARRGRIEKETQITDSHTHNLYHQNFSTRFLIPFQFIALRPFEFFTMTPPEQPQQQCYQQNNQQPLTKQSSFDCTASIVHRPPPPRRLMFFRSAVIGPQPVFQQAQITTTNDYFLQSKNQFEVPSVFDSLKHQKQPVFSVQGGGSRSSGKATAASTATTTADSSSTFVAVDGWKSPSLTRLSMFHPLEQCHVTFPKHVLLSHMLPALMDTFQKTSLLVSNFCDSPIAVSCESMERVQFQVSLWASRQQCDVVILEIQKVSGDAVNFQAYAQQILATARAVVATTSTSTTATSTTSRITVERQQYQPAKWQQHHHQPQPCAPFVSQETDDMEEHVEQFAVGWNMPAAVAADRVWKGDVKAFFNVAQVTTEALEILHGILFSDRYDACRLGLESACCMTDPSKTGWSTACLVAQALLAPSNVMQQQISSRILLWTTLQSDHDAAETNWHVQELSYLALQALAQALQVAAEAQPTNAAVPGMTTASSSATSCSLLSTFLDTTCGAQDLDLVAFLLNKVRTVQQSPHTAYFAIRALTALCQAMPQVSCRIAHQDVEYAQQVGVATHAALATVSGRLLVTLQAC
jgi:hypothetical protein